MAPPLITVVVLNWNGGRYLPRCLEALQAQTWRDFTTLVVDDASSDGSAQMVADYGPGFRLLPQAHNLGFCRANNAALPHVHSPWVAFLNNDAYPFPDWLEQIAAAIAACPPESFFASCLVPDGTPQIVQSAGDVVHAAGFAWPGHAGQPVSSLPPGRSEVFSASGAALVAPTQRVLALGGFDPTFGSHLEDVDLCFRLRLQGCTGWLVPGALVAHTGSASYGLESAYTVHQVLRNGWWLYLADMPGLLVWKYLPLRILLSGLMTLNYLRRGRGRAALKAQWHALCGAPAALRKRRRVQASRQVSAAAVEQKLARRAWEPLLLGKFGRGLRRQLRRG